MNLWGVLIVGVGFLFLYMGIKNKGPGYLVSTFAPRSTQPNPGAGVGGAVTQSPSTGVGGTVNNGPGAGLGGAVR